jgi:hypothetical protein
MQRHMHGACCSFMPRIKLMACHHLISHHYVCRCAFYVVTFFGGGLIISPCGQTQKSKDSFSCLMRHEGSCASHMLTHRTAAQETANRKASTGHKRSSSAQGTMKPREVTVSREREAAASSKGRPPRRTPLSLNHGSRPSEDARKTREFTSESSAPLLPGRPRTSCSHNPAAFAACLQQRRELALFC